MRACCPACSCSPMPGFPLHAEVLYLEARFLLIPLVCGFLTGVFLLLGAEFLAGTREGFLLQPPASGAGPPVPGRSPVWCQAPGDV